MFRAGAAFQLITTCCNAVATSSRKAKSINLCQAAVLAGYVPSAGELLHLKLEATHDRSADHLIQQLLNWLNEDRQQVPSLQRQCRVVIRRQLSVAVHFQSILPAIDKLQLPTKLKLYLQFDGTLTEVDLSVNKKSTEKTSRVNRRQLLSPYDTEYSLYDFRYDYGYNAHVSDDDDNCYDSDSDESYWCVDVTENNE